MISLYDMSVPVYTRSLENLLVVLKAGEKWADENNVPHEKLIQARLAPPLTFQIYTACNTSKSVLTRIAGQENPSMDDNQTTFAELYDRVQKTIDALNTAKPENFEGKEDAEVSLFDGKVIFNGLTYLQKFGLPNFFFHVTAAYAILRNQGVPVGKYDFIGRSV